jgi:hypothetical protein
MAIENKQIRWVWGLLVTIPVVLKNKMIGFNEADNGAGRDRTQMEAKGPTGDIHNFRTYEEIQDYVTTQLAGFNLDNGSPYFIATTLEELKVLLLTAGNFTIYCDSGTGEGIVVQSDEVSGLSYVDKKELIGAGGTVLAIDSFGGVTTDVVFDSASGARLLIKDRILFRAHAPVVTIRNDGDGFLYLSEITPGTGVTSPTTLNVYNQGTVTDDPDRCVLECNNLDQVITQEYTSMKFGLWSGKYTQFKRDIFDNINPVEVNTIVEVDHATPAGDTFGKISKITVTSKRVVTIGLARNNITHLVDDNGTEYIFSDTETNRGSPTGSLPAYELKKLWSGSSLDTVMSLYGDGSIYLNGNIKSGTSQGLAGAFANEIWRDTADNSLKIGV